MDSGINFNGSNTITLDEILGGRHWEGDGTGSNSPAAAPGSAQYDAMETEDEADEEQLERERQEFMAAIRRAREEEDRARERLLRIDEVLSRQKKDELGRVFGGEGDVADEVRAVPVSEN